MGRSGSERQKKTKGWRMRRWMWWVLAGIGTLLLVVVLVAGAYFSHLHEEIDARFGSRKWSIPSTVFSDTVLIFPGQSLSKEVTVELFAERNYREAGEEAPSPGEYRVEDDAVTVHLRRFNFPGRSLPEQRVKFAFADGKLATIEGEQGLLSLLELEPLEIARMYGAERERRLLINIETASPHLRDAVVAIEDHRFFEHPGVDWYGIARALYADIKTGRLSQGGSTITQQLVKNYFLTPEKTLRRKFVEACMSLVLELHYSKEQILEMYMNEIYMGQRRGIAVHGMGEAAYYYFGRNVEDLSLSESAVLAGMIQAPNRFSPFRNPEDAVERRNVVLQRMLEVGAIDEAAYDRAHEEELRARRRVLPARLAPYYMDYVEEQLRDLYSPEVLETEGLSVYTSLQPEIALAAQEAVRSGLEELEKKHAHLAKGLPERPLQAALVAVQPRTGAVLALVGGRDYATAQFNRALRAKRQPGSVIKPFVYLTGLEKFSPVDVLEDQPIVLQWEGQSWSPSNYDHQFRGEVTFRQALEKSLNVPTVNVATAVGLEKVIETVHRFGMESAMKPVPSLALGAFEATPIEVAEAYAAIANEGQKPFLLSLKEVVTEQGRVEQRRHVGLETVTSPAKAFIITSILEGVIDHGTGRGVRRAGIDYPCAGKTGTSSDYRDSWFVGFTSDLLVAVWVGYDDNGPTGLSGASGALPIWVEFMKRIEPWIHARSFRVPPGVLVRRVCTDSKDPFDHSCRKTRREYFLPEHVR